MKMDFQTSNPSTQARYTQLPSGHFKTQTRTTQAEPQPSQPCRCGGNPSGIRHLNVPSHSHRTTNHYERSSIGAPSQNLNRPDRLLDVVAVVVDCPIIVAIVVIAIFGCSALNNFYGVMFYHLRCFIGNRLSITFLLVHL